MRDGEISLKEPLLWRVLVIGKMRLGWLLYNTVYIHLFRMKYRDGIFEHLTFKQWYYLAMKGLFETQGYDYDGVRKARNES